MKGGKGNIWGNMREDVNGIVEAVLEERPKRERIWELYLEGKTYREIAAAIYGSDEWVYVNRVAQHIAKVRRRLGSTFLRIVDVEPQLADTEITELFNAGGEVVVKKRGIKSRFKRQLVEHEQFIYYIVRRLGFGAGSEVFAAVKAYHYRLFPRAWTRWADSLRCWRNGGNKVPFSFSLASLAYVTALVRAVLILFGYGVSVDGVVRELLPTQKRSMLLKFNTVFAEVGGWVLGSILHPQL